MADTVRPLFIFPYSRQLKESEAVAVMAGMQSFLSSWDSHGVAVMAGARLEDSHFLLVEILSELPGGCSKDKLFRFVSLLNADLGLPEAGAGSFFIQSKGEVLVLSRKDLKNNIMEGRLNAGDLLYPTWISLNSEFSSLWKKPLSAFPALFPSRDLV